MRSDARQQKIKIFGQGGGRAKRTGPCCSGAFAKTFYFFENICYTMQMFDNFQSFPYEVRKLEATEARLERIYNASKLGLKGDSLALAAGMLPTEYRQLTQLDPIAEMAELKGKADGEAEMANVLRDAALAGDAKSALEVLKHQHGWVAKQQLSIDVEQRISITQALEQAQSRVIEGVFKQVENATDATKMFHVEPQLKQTA